ncbi:MAG: 4-alpha-glucanotransferase [Desulfomonile tiedjei]|nr:4-alpha-glucanotransferase [Desulfomonile tiedjei]
MLNIYQALRTVGEIFGIEAQYIDTWGKVRRTDPKTAARVLKAKGLTISTEQLALDPQVVVVSIDDLPSRCSVYLAERITDEALASPVGQITVSGGEGTSLYHEYSFDGEAALVDADDDTGLVRLSFPFPQELETGPYKVRVEAVIGRETHSCSCIWIVCPAKAYLPPDIQTGRRVAGVGLALYGVRSEKNWGIGDFSDLIKIIDWAHEELHVDFVGLNPLHALFNKRPCTSSPYLPSSRLFRNFIYLDVPGMEDYSGSKKAQALLESPETRRRIQALRDETQVNYEEVSALKLLILRELFRNFLENHRKPGGGTNRWKEFAEFITSGGVHLERYATFCALQEHFQESLPEAESWRDWPAAFHDPESEQVKDFQAKNEDQILFWAYLQWQIDEQLNWAQQHALGLGMLIGLYHDEALAVDRNGADFWAWREFFHEGFRVGAPPDEFAPDGQDWGFPPPNGDKIRSSGYDLFFRKLGASCKRGGALRIDHVMQFSHLFWIPDGGKPAQGVYVKDNEADLLNLLALVSQDTKTLIVGEDLGTVPPQFRERLMAKDILSYRLFYFERDYEGNLTPHYAYPEAALVSISTHDLPTLGGFWSGGDIATRRGIGQLSEERAKAFTEERARSKTKILERLVQDGFLDDEGARFARESKLPTDELHSAVIAFLLHTNSKLVMINQEDVFLDVRQQNFPGTTWEHPNWVTKMRYSVEELRNNPDALRYARKFKELVEKSGRSE